MYTPSQAELDFLLALHQQTHGEPDGQCSMYEIGESLGLDKNLASDLCQDMMIEELIELKSLSGSVSFLPNGIEALQHAGLIQGGTAPHRLGPGPILDETDSQLTNEFIAEIKGSISAAVQPYPLLEELVIDIKTVEVQLHSPRPKTTVIRSLLNAIGENIERLDGQLAQRLSAFIES